MGGFPDGEGELSSTKCGKLISHNFVEIGPAESFLANKVQTLFHSVTCQCVCFCFNLLGVGPSV